MKLRQVVTISFFVSLLLSIVAAILKYNKVEESGYWLVAGIISMFVFIISAILEVRKSERINSDEKRMWIIAFIFCGGISGIIYFLFGRRRVV